MRISSSANQLHINAVSETKRPPQPPAFNNVGRAVIRAAALRINERMAQLPKPPEKPPVEVQIMKDCLNSLFRKAIFPSG